MATILGLGLAACSGPAGEGGSCVSNKDCGDGFACISGGCLATRPTSDRCTMNEQCEVTGFCDVDTGACIAKPQVGCTMDEQCGADQRCNTLTSVCVDLPRSCGQGGMCPAGRQCETTTNACVQCLGPEHCGLDQLCENNACVQDKPEPPPPGGCNDDATCNPPLTICDEQMCTLGCAQPGGLNCVDGAVCDTGTGHCVTIEGPCADDNDCTPPMTVCESGQCIPGCGEIGGLQCPGGQQCNQNSGRCQTGGVICISDDDCNSPMTICNLFSGVCDPGCADTGCTAPETCNAGTGHCEGTATCMPDRFEPNESPAAAAMTNGGALTGMTVCPGDQDYFAVTLGQGDSVDVTLSFTHGEGNLDLELLAPNGQVVANSASTLGTEMINYAASAPGTYIVHVIMTRDTGAIPGNTYTLTIRANIAPCAMDRDEANNSDGNAALILPGARNGRNVCLGDEDFYDVILQDGDTLDVDLTFSHAEGDIDVQILGFLGIPLASGSSSTDNESVSYTATRFGFFTVRVWLTADTGTVLGNPYDMNVSVGSMPPPPPPPPPICANDGFEENDSAAAARALTPGTHSGLNVCTGDDDYYAYTLAQGDTMTVNVTFNHAEGDIDARLLDSGGTELAVGRSSDSNETFTYTAASAGTYDLRVHLYADTGSTPGNPYGLDVQVAGAPAGCVADSFEPNNDIAAATTAPSGTIANLAICENDDDFYAVNLSSGQAATFDALFANAEGDIDLRLFDPAGTQVASSLTVDDNESISYTPTQSGTFVVRANLYQDAGTIQGNSYQLVVAP